MGRREDSTGGEDLREELIKNGAPNLERCIQCGTCTSSCTVFELDQSYNPRKLIQMFLVGDASDEIKEVWLCSTCGVCVERCPRDVLPMNVMLSARGLQIRSSMKDVPKERLRSLISIYRSGFAFKKKRGLRAQRSALKLPDFDLDEIQLEQVRASMMPLLDKKLMHQMSKR
ncbi:MAG: 4Fe-4S dicluster domain-containing protein [Thermoproteota archaeon]